MTPSEEEARRLLRMANRDYRTFAILRDHAEADLASTCFHAQQAVEKALKAALTSRGIDYRRGHDLEELAHLLSDAGLSPPFAPRDYRRLNPFAVEFRYDDQSVILVTRAEADEIAAQTLRWAGEIVTASSR